MAVGIDVLASALERVAMGKETAQDERDLASVFTVPPGAAAARSEAVQFVARQYGQALAAAIRGGGPWRQTLDGFLRILAVGRLEGTDKGVMLVPHAGVDEARFRVAEEALRIAWASTGSHSSRLVVAQASGFGPPAGKPT